MSEKQARAARRASGALMFRCTTCDGIYVSQPDRRDLCRCGAYDGAAHPDRWVRVLRSDGPTTPAALAWWDRTFGPVPQLWYCPPCWAAGEALVPFLGPPPWEQESA